MVMNDSCWGEEEEELERKTRAKPGAGTGIVHVLRSRSQVMVVRLSLPRKRPSTVKSLPRVWKKKKKRNCLLVIFLCLRKGIFFFT